MIGEKIGPTVRIEELKLLRLTPYATALGRSAIENNFTLEQALADLQQSTPPNEKDDKYLTYYANAYEELLPYIEQLGIAEN